MIVELFLTIIIVSIVYWYLSKPKNAPPGPQGIPILGYLPWLLYYSNDRVNLFLRLKEKYGNLVFFRTGFSNVLLLNGVETIKQAFSRQGEQFSGRGLELIRKEITGGKGILSTEGHWQREHRRFILRTLRNMGFGKMTFEEHVMESIHHMHARIDEHISKNGFKDMDIRECLVEAVADNITQIVLGVKFSEEELKFMITRLEMAADVPPIIFLVNSVPILYPLVYFTWFKRAVGIELFKKVRKPLEARIIKYVKNFKETFDENDLSNFIYAYIDEQKRHTSSEEEKDAWDDNQIMHAATELLAAGMGTTDASIMWILALTANKQDWQKLVRQEVDSVLGQTKPPSMSDLPSLPKCEATVLETLRWSILASTGIPHSVTEDATLYGYSIPKGTTVFPNLYETTRDPTVWKDPENFNPPLNFMHEDGVTVINRDKDIPFTVGRRSCIGESLARMEVTLFFVSFIQKYEIYVSEERGCPEPATGIFRMPLHRLLRFKKRNI